MEAASKKAKANDTSWLEALAGPQQWRSSDAKRVIASWEESGMTLADFANEHGINAQRIGWWQKRLATTAASTPAAALQFAPVTLRETPTPALQFAPVTLREKPTPTVRQSVVLSLPCGVRVEVAEPDGVSPAWIAAVVRAIAVAGGAP